MSLYWDSASIIPWLVTEEDTQIIKRIVEKSASESHYTSWLTIFEVETALKKKLNRKQITPDDYETAQDLWMALQRQMNFIVLDAWVARAGARFQRLYGMKSGDSVQLGSASLVQSTQAGVVFLSLDQQLVRYAKQEGFEVPDQR